MRILLISHGFPPANLGGTEIYTRDLGLALVAEYGDDVHVLTRESDADRREYELRRRVVDGITVHAVNNTFGRCRSFAETYRNPTIRRIGARLIDEIEPDVCHIQHLTCLSTELVDELAAQSVPTVFTLNDYWLICHRGQLLDVDMQACSGPETGCGRCIVQHAGLGRSGFSAAAALRLVQRCIPAFLGQRLRGFGDRVAKGMQNADLAADQADKRRRHMLEVTSKVSRLLAPSQTLRDSFLEFGVDEDRIVHIQQGIDHRPLSSVRPVRGAPVRFGFLGSMMESKGAHILLEAFAALPVGAATLEIFGGFAPYHGDMSYADKVAPLLEHPGVHRRGAVPHSEIAVAFSRFDVLVVPSIWLENAPFVIREAFVAGRPVVTSDHGGMAEMVEHEASGLRFAPGDVAGLQIVLRRFVDDPDLVRRLQSGIPPMMTIEEDAAQLRALYRQIGAVS